MIKSPCKGSWNHPRACGENVCCYLYYWCPRGSPPRMRGKPALTTGSAASRRITPAHAGKTGRIHAVEMVFRDHPRACGENSLKVSTRQHRRGSPPRMRGKPHGRPNPKATVRITPAHAGKTNCGNDSTCGLQDHPRACGENAPSCVIDALATRITPAHAGKTHLCRLQNRCNKDHPRACGENKDPSLHVYAHGGSPPRMRGKR